MKEIRVKDKNVQIYESLDEMKANDNKCEICGRVITEMVGAYSDKILYPCMDMCVEVNKVHRHTFDKATGKRIIDRLKQYM